MYERKPWSEKEDITLRELREVRKISKWSQISQIMKDQFQIFGRNGKQCRQRYHNHLDSNISKQKWTPEQEETLLRLHNELGNRWATICRQLAGRTDNCVKNHFYSILRRGIKQINVLIDSKNKKKVKAIRLGIINKVIAVSETFIKGSSMYSRQTFQLATFIKNSIASFYTQSDAQIEQKLAKIESLNNKIIEFSQICRKKIPKKKKSRTQSEQSQQPKQLAYETLRSIKIPQQIKQQHIPLQQVVQVRCNLEFGQVPSIKHIEAQQNATVSAIIQTPVKSPNKGDVERNSCSCAFHSVNSLDGKNSLMSCKDEIGDDDKQWRLDFE